MTFINIVTQNYQNIISEQNKKYYEENKKEIIKKKLENYHKNKKITNNKYDDYLHLDNNINILKPELPNNFSLFKEDKYIYLQFSKLIKGEKLYCKNKISNINLMAVCKYPNFFIRFVCQKWNHIHKTGDLVLKIIIKTTQILVI